MTRTGELRPVVGLVDYGAGNLFSIANAFENAGADVVRVHRQEDLHSVSHVVLPGVGAFRHCRENLDRSGLVPALTRWALEDRHPIFGICVGMQLMVDRGWEFGQTDGLGWFPGDVTRLKESPPANRVPHVGWSETTFRQALPGIPEGTSLDYYYDHSFAVESVPERFVLATCEHTRRFPSMLRWGNILASQCHPEKSQRAGMMLIQGFLALSGNADG